jgi:hypothetical protein
LRIAQLLRTEFFKPKVQIQSTKFEFDFWNLSDIGSLVLGIFMGQVDVIFRAASRYQTLNGDRNVFSVMAIVKEEKNTRFS